MDKGRIIGMKEAGESTREVSRVTGHDRKTIAKIGNEYQALSAELKEPGVDTKTVQEKMTAEAKYDSSGRVRRKYTPELDARLKEIVGEEKRKDRQMGPGHKQKLTNRQIHAKLKEEGYRISEVTINIALAAIRKRQREVFIRQSYGLGERLEYDLGEVYLNCGEGMKTSPLSKDMRKRIITSRDEGNSYAKIAKELQVNISTAVRIVKLKAQTGKLDPRPLNNGRKPRLDEEMLQKIQERIEQEPDISLRELIEEYENVFYSVYMHFSIGNV